MKRAALPWIVAVLVAGCGSSAPHGIPSSLLRGVRPIGRGPRFEPPVRGPVTGACVAPLGDRLEAHVEVFGADRVVLLPAGIGTRPPLELRDGRLTRASCFGDLVTLDPTGTVYFRPGRKLTLGDLFTAWGQPLTATRIASFRAGTVRAFVNGRAVAGSPRRIVLTPHAEIVLEAGPWVPPHTRFSFSQAPPAGLG